MNKSDLVAKMCEKYELSKKDATDIVEAVLNGIQESIVSGDDVALAGFGTFKRTIRPERNGFNPATGEKIKISESVSVKFSPSKVLKEQLQKSS
jgi:DNA-binding protein HU-beta